jgi:pentatricopeptide repeat protein
MIKDLLLTRHRIVSLAGSRGSLKRSSVSVGSIRFRCTLLCTEQTRSGVDHHFSHAKRIHHGNFFFDRYIISSSNLVSSLITRYFSVDAPRQKRQPVATEEIHQKARDLLNPDLFPLGSFTTEQYAAVKFVLYHFINLQQPKSKEDVNTPFDILLRLVREIAHVLPKSANSPNDPFDVLSKPRSSSNVMTYEWLLNANYYNPIFANWKNASLRNRIIGIYSGLDIMQNIQLMSQALPPSIFKYNMYTVTMILQVIIKQVRRDEAPIVAEKLLDAMQQQLSIQIRNAEHDKHRSATWHKEIESYQPNQYIFSILLKAWAESRLDNSQEKIEIILEDMKQRGVHCNYVTYNILLHFYSRLGAVDHVNRILQQMHAEGISITVDCLVQALLCCSKAGLVENASEILRTIVQNHADSPERQSSVGEGIQHILMAYRDKVARRESFNLEGTDDVTDEVRQYREQNLIATVDAARALVDDPEIVQALDAPSKGTCLERGGLRFVLSSSVSKMLYVFHQSECI